MRESVLSDLSAQPTVALLVVVLALSQGVVQAQSETTPDGSSDVPFVERVDVNVVNIEVSVTRNGRPVDGLTKEDFIVEDDGNEVEISNFYAVEKGTRQSPGAPVPDAETESFDVQIQPSFVVILIDNTFIAPASRKRVVDRLQEHLDALLDAGSRIMVVDKAREIEIIQGFTTDRMEVEAAIESIAKSSAEGGQNVAAERLVRRRIDMGARPALTIGAGGADPAAADAQATFAEIQAYAEEMSSHTRRSAAVLRHFITSLSGLEGRKAVIHVADELPLQIGESLFNTWFDKYSTYSELVGVFSAGEALLDFDNSDVILDLVTEAATNRVTFYPLSSGDTATVTAASARSGSVSEAPSFSSRTAASEGTGLRLLARQTGGDWASNLANLDPVVERMTTDLASYYSIGYPSPHAADGERHRIKVRVRGRDDLDLRYQTSYVDKDGDRIMTDRTLAALMMDADRNPLAAWVEVGEPERQKRNRYVVPIAVKLPLANLALIPQDQKHVGSVSVFVVVQDEEGRISQPQRIPVPGLHTKRTLRAGQHHGRGLRHQARHAARSPDDRHRSPRRHQYGRLDSTGRVRRRRQEAVARL